MRSFLVDHIGKQVEMRKNTNDHNVMSRQFCPKLVTARKTSIKTDKIVLRGDRKRKRMHI
jgi:hypothetical protein